MLFRSGTGFSRNRASTSRLSSHDTATACACDARPGGWKRTRCVFSGLMPLRPGNRPGAARAFGHGDARSDDEHEAWRWVTALPRASVDTDMPTEWMPGSGYGAQCARADADCGHDSVNCQTLLWGFILFHFSRNVPFTKATTPVFARRGARSVDASARGGE